MERNIPGGDLGYTAEVALGEGVGAVTGTDANEVALPIADGERIKGVTAYEVSAAEDVTLHKLGKVKLAIVGPFDDGDELIVAATTGKFKKFVPNYGGGIVYISAIAEESGASDDIEGYGSLVCYARNDTIYHSASANPSANNDGIDTASLGATFQVGALWLNESDGGLFRCSDNSTGAAVWAEATFS